MPYDELLSLERSPLRTLRLERLRLCREEPLLEVKSGGDELLLYGLIGAVAVEAAAEEGHRLTAELRPLRWRVDARGAVAFRLPGGQAWTATVRALERSADYLVVRRSLRLPIQGTAANTADPSLLTPPPVAPLVHEAQTDEVHQVGEGAYQREVRTFETPEGYRLQCGETLNPPGHWSSWPRHVPIDERSRDHQEVFFVITPGWGLVRRQGWYATLGHVDDVRLVSNGEALVMPLGAHPIVASPEAWLYYFWCYESTALQKTYNQFATDVGTYAS